jgi:hypothetical protein
VIYDANNRIQNERALHTIELAMIGPETAPVCVASDNSEHAARRTSPRRSATILKFDSSHARLFIRNEVK